MQVPIYQIDAFTDRIFAEFGGDYGVERIWQNISGPVPHYHPSSRSYELRAATSSIRKRRIVS